ncbi:MAG: alpha/beta hydrolase [Saprospiraceae bacterium]
MKLKYLLPIFAIVLIGCQSEQTADKPTNLPKLEDFTFESAFIDKKQYSVYLPPSYNDSLKKDYPVLYLMDGQVQFGGKSPLSNASWNSHLVADSLMSLGEMKEAILIGVHHAGEKRFEEYMPQKPLDRLPKSDKDSIRNKVEYTVYSDAFLKFLVRELKPAIDKKYRTLSDVENTFIGGSSMGGLLAMYATCDYPDVFGGAICMSTNWPISDEDTSPFIADEVVGYFERTLPTGKKWYFDLGTRGLDQYYEKYQITVDIIMKEKGYKRGLDWVTIKWHNHDHNEIYWSQRLSLPFQFIFKK